MSQDTPTVSAIVPCYNSEATIERCLKSILDQTLPVTEILVYDDCSQDASAEILARLSAEHSCIRVISGSENKGAGHARTTLLQAASSQYLAFLDSDDVWHPQKLEVQIGLLQQENADIVACNYDIVDAQGEKLDTRTLPALITRFKMHLRNQIPTSMSVLRSDLKGCRAMPLIRRRQDYAYWLNIFAQNPGLKCITTPEILGTYYRMPGSLSSSMLANFKANYQMYRHVVGYSAPLAGLCVCANAITRVFRL